MPKELIDDQLWSLIEPLLPEQVPRNRQYAGRKPLPDRAVLTGIVFVLRSGIAWNLMPQEMGCGSGTACWRRLGAPNLILLLQFLLHSWGILPM